MDAPIDRLSGPAGGMECVFCRIVGGGAPAEWVHKDEHVVAFLDIRPISRGHTLVIPRRHCTDLTEADPETAGRMFTVAHRIAVGMRRPPIDADGVNLAINDGRAAFQSVFHSHIHVVPRWTRDRFRFAAGFLTRRAGDAGVIGAQVRAALADPKRADSDSAG